MSFPARRLLSGLCAVPALLALSACERSLHSLDGPFVGLVTGLACNEIAALEAVAMLPAASRQLVREGKCVELRRPREVQVLRTVELPGQGRYAQFELVENAGTRTLWTIATSICAT